MNAPGRKCIVKVAMAFIADKSHLFSCASAQDRLLLIVALRTSSWEEVSTRDIIQKEPTYCLYINLHAPQDLLMGFNGVLIL